jgi:hypothetical protein
MRERIVPGLLLACATLLSALSAACGSKPCATVAPSESAKKLGIVLDGGRLCKEDGDSAIIQYPESTAEALPAQYTGTLGKAAWKVDVDAGTTLLMTRDAETLFIVTVKDKDSGLATAVVRHCADAGCREYLAGLAGAMKKQ